MKHAGNDALDALEDLLKKIRMHAALKEKKRGIFYLKRSAFLHFHDDPTGTFADVKVGAEYRRFPVNGRASQRKLLEVIAQALQESS